MAWLRLRAKDGALVLEPVKVAEVPQPGGRFAFAGNDYSLSNDQLVVTREHLDVGPYDGFEAEVMTMTVAAVTPVPTKDPTKGKKPTAVPAPTDPVPTPVAPVTADEERYLGVRHSDMVLDSTCVVCRTVARGWIVCVGGKAFCAACDSRFPLVSAWAKQLNERCPEPTNDEKHWAILPRALAQNSACSCSSGDIRTWTEVERRGDYEVASVRQGVIGGELAFCEDCIRTHPTDALRATLDEFYGKQRALKPPPVAPPPPPSAAELAERDRLRRETEALAMAARAIWPIPDHALVTKANADRVKNLFLALELWRACRPSKEAR
jgi:hypothetical protein